MPIFFPDILENNNPNFPLVDATFLKGNSYPLTSINDTGSIPSNKRNVGVVVFDTTAQEFYAFKGTTVAGWDTPSNWIRFGDGDAGLVTASISNATITFEKGDGSTFDLTVNNVESSSYAATASIASDIYKQSGTVTVGIGADADIVTISGSIIKLGNPTLPTETLVSNALSVTGSLKVHNPLGNGFYTVGVDNNGDVQMGADTFLNILLKDDGTSVLYNGVYVSASITVDAGSVLTLNPVHPLPLILCIKCFICPCSN